MDAREIAWRLGALARTMLDRVAYWTGAAKWRRANLRRALTPDPSLAAVRTALRHEQWNDAHRELQRHVVERGSHFLVRTADRRGVADRVARAFPHAAADAVARADRILAGRYDLLGYRALDYSRSSDRGARLKPSHSTASLPDWHFDPVNRRRAPIAFWASVPFLDPASGDHKVIWEVNRHQHWLALGRAYWLTGERKYRDHFVRELRDWLSANPPLTGINWASMLELAFRCLSWTWALHFFADAAADDGDAAWSVDLLLALDRQLTHIERNLSYYFSPNTHLVGEALALYVTGRTLPELSASGRRVALGRHILVSEIARQIEADGGHCERSAHYHRYTLDFYLLALAVARITGDPIAPVFERAAGRLAAAARLLADDRGRAPHLGDDDGGSLFPIAGRAVDDWRDSLAIAAALTGSDEIGSDGAPCEEAIWMLAHPALSPALEPNKRAAEAASSRRSASSAALPSTGYYVSRSEAGEHIVIDGGPHGFLNAGHAHADALSLTFSIRGLPFLIDTGTATYTNDAALRDRFRTTAAHNTVVIDGQPQSLGAGAFQWTRRTDAATHRWRSADGFDYFDGSHSGYAPTIHRRRALMLHGSLLVVADYIGVAGDGRTHEACVHWHVSPDWHAVPDDRSVTLTSRHDRVTFAAPHGRIELFKGDDRTRLGWYSPVYGRIEPCHTLRLTQAGATPFWIVSVFDLNPLDPLRSVDSLPVWAEAGAIAHAAALRIARRASTDYVLFAEPAHADLHTTWRVAEFETDARMLFGRLSGTGELVELALVDGSFVRGGGRRAVGLALGHQTSALHIDEISIRNYTPCAVSPGS